MGLTLAPLEDAGGQKGPTHRKVPKFLAFDSRDVMPHGLTTSPEIYTVYILLCELTTL